MSAPAVVDTTWLADHLGEDGLVVLDASVGDARDTDRRIPVARRFDIDGEMSKHDGGVHTLPDADDFTRAVRRLGINADSRVVVYDAQGLFSAPRARWMLRTAGHDGVSVLDGGLPAWLAAGHETQPWADEPAPEPGDFTAQPFGDRVVDRTELKSLLGHPGTVVADARSAGRFAGTDPEPRPGMPSGHMPGAVNLPFTDLLVDGKLRPTSELADAVRKIVGDDQDLVVSCGSGVTACVIALAAELAGRDSRLYDGSWSEWAVTEPDTIEPAPARG